MEDAIIFNEQDLTLQNKKKLKLLYLWKEKRFIFNAYNIRQDTADYLGIRKSEVTQYLFDHMKFVYLEPDKKHISTYDGINAIFFKVDNKSNPKIYKVLEDLYNKKLLEMNKTKEDNN
jgi:hypothetical protein